MTTDSPSSTIHRFFATARARGERVALQVREAGGWRAIAWSDYARDVRRLGRALIALGVPVGGTVAIIGPNRPEWLIADLGAIAAGAVPAPIYTTCTADQVGYIAAHAEATVAVVADVAQLAKFRSQNLPKLRQLVLMEGEAPGALGWQAFLSLGDQVPDAQLDERLTAISPAQLATLIYTSGTTGQPKAVMLTHRNLQFISEKSIELVGLGADDEVISYLPLSHIAEQMISIHSAAVAGTTIWCCDRFELLGDTLRDARPTLFFGVPRVWEKMQAKMVEAGKSAPWLKRKIAAWARSVGLAAGYARERNRPLPLFYGLAKRLVFGTVRRRLGFDRARFCATAAAPITKATLEFFLSLDLPIYECYGMSESTGPGTFSSVGSFRVGAVGQVMPGTEIKLAEDGEICMRGPHIFAGYYKDDAATREAIDTEGWLHSGDIGERDADGFYRITDRKKDLFKTSGGKYIAPQSLEARLKTIPGVGEAVVLGSGRKYAVALLTLDPEGVDRPGDPNVVRRLDGEIARINQGLAPYETIKRFTILPAPLSVDAGELTPTLKVKRKVVSDRYAKEIDALYDRA